MVNVEGKKVVIVLPKSEENGSCWPVQEVTYGPGFAGVKGDDRIGKKVTAQLNQLPQSPKEYIVVVDDHKTSVT